MKYSTLLLSVCCLLNGVSAFGRDLTYDTAKAGAWTIDLSGCSNTVNIAKWKVCVNGAEVPRAQMLYKDGELRAVPPGFVILFR